MCADPKAKKIRITDKNIRVDIPKPRNNAPLQNITKNYDNYNNSADRQQPGNPQNVDAFGNARVPQPKNTNFNGYNQPQNQDIEEGIFFPGAKTQISTQEFP